MMSVDARKSAFGALAVLAAVAAGLAGCNHSQPPKPNKNPRVVVTKPVRGQVVDYQDFTGRLDAFRSVEVKARVTGHITAAPFREGDLIREGQLLFQIDRRPFEADLNQAEANLKVSIADRNFQEKSVERYRKAGVANVSREEMETVQAAFEKAVAKVAADQAAVERARLYLDYTAVKAPLTGRVSRRYVDPGNLVTADNTALASIVAEQQVYAYFDVDERTYLDLLALVAPGTKEWTDGLKLPVLMRVANEEEFHTVGQVDFVDNRVVATTGTVRMRGVFENLKGFLKTGLFVRIRLPLGNAYDALMIPDEAIQSDQERKYVWVVNVHDETEYRTVDPGQSVGGLRVIKAPAAGKDGQEGLREGDRVIVSGMQRVRNGVTVDAETHPPPAPPEVPLVQVLAKKA
jgi:RND family efflux transporter MFP subunit